MRRSLLKLVLGMVVALMPMTTLMAEIAPREKARIEALIADVGSLGEAKFIRNGSSHDPATAVKFLRGKWNAKTTEISTAEEFIAKAATISATTGQPYLIRMKDGTEKKCADYMNEKLKQIDAAAK